MGILAVYVGLPAFAGAKGDYGLSRERKATMVLAFAGAKGDYWPGRFALRFCKRFSFREHVLPAR